MLAEGVVVSLDGYNAVVRVKQNEACFECHGNCGACSKTNVHDICASNAINACLGDSVSVESKSSIIYALVFLLYMLPIMTMPAVYFLTVSYFGEMISSVLSFVCCIFLFCLIYLTAAKRISTKIKYSIVRIK